MTKNPPLIEKTGLPPRNNKLSYRNLIGESAWSRLHPSIRKRFSEARCNTPVSYQGTMKIIFLSFAGKLLAQLCRLMGTPLALYSENNVPTRVDVYPNKQLKGMTWVRNYHYSNGKINRIKSTKCLSEDKGLIEVVGFGFGMQLNLSETMGAIQFESQRFFLQVGRRRITIPALFTPGKTIVIQRALDSTLFEFILKVDHPLLGRVFYQEGIFSEIDNCGVR